MCLGGGWPPATRLAIKLGSAERRASEQKREPAGRLNEQILEGGSSSSGRCVRGESKRSLNLSCKYIGLSIWISEWKGEKKEPLTLFKLWVQMRCFFACLQQLKRNETKMMFVSLGLTSGIYHHETID